MLDIQYIRDNPDLVDTKSRQKGYSVDISRLLQLDGERRQLTIQVEELRARRRALAGGTARPDAAEAAAGRQIKTDIAGLEGRLKTIDQEYQALLAQVPNMPLDDVPVGSTEAENVVASTVGELPEFEFEPRQHHQILEPRDLIDKQRAAKISGSRFAYIKGDLVRLQFAVIQFVMDTLTDESVIAQVIADNGLNIDAKPFVPVLPPAVLRTEPYVASARLNAEEVTYRIEQDDLWLNASAEHTLCTMYWNEILPEDALPIRYIGYSTSFRREAGTYGKDTEGILRMHQFDKLEMETFSTAATGLDEHHLQIALQEHMLGRLGLPYRVMLKCTADIGKPNARGVDIDCWFPGQGRYRETHTADYMTDYQARDLRVRYKSGAGNGRTELVHTNDATAFALGRIMAAITENNQTADGRIRIPEPLRKYMGGRTEL